MSPPADEPAQEAGLAKGASLERYVVLGLLGRGGMGEVYAAYDPDLDRKIAVKLLRASAGGSLDADGSTRLLREAQAIARLSHPNVVVVYDVGTFNDSVFIAMEFVEGSTIGYWLAAAERGWRQVLDVYLAAGRGLAAAHAAGLVHRDFKPENVMITRTGQVRVMDFGLARVENSGPGAPPVDDPAELAARAAALAEALQEQAADVTMKIPAEGSAATPVTTGSGQYLGLKLTQTGAVLGTPAYMAPEQFAGERGDARSDQFAFCVALYEGIYRTRPFEGTTPAVLMTSVVTGAITDPPPDTRVPGWIRRVLLRGLSSKPQDRFASMDDLLAALVQNPAARRRRWIGAAMGAVLIAGTAVGASRFTAGRRVLCAGGPGRAARAWGPDRRAAVAHAFDASGNKNAASVLASVSSSIDDYVARWEAMYRETCEATQVRGEQSAEVLDLRMSCLDERLADVRALADVLGSADARVVESARSAASALPTLERCADVPMLRAVIKPPDDPVKRAEVASLGESVAKLTALASTGRCADAKAMGIPLLDRAKKLGYRPLEAETALGFGRLADSCLDPAVAGEYLEESVLAAEASNDEETAIRSSSFLSVLYSDRLGNAALGGYWVRHADALLERFPNHPILAAEAASARAVWLGATGHDEEALAELRRSLALRERAGDASSVEAADTILNVMIRLHALGRDAEAVSAGKRAVDLYGRLVGSDSGQTALALMDLSESLLALNRVEEALADVDRAIAIWRPSGATFFVAYGLLDRGRIEIAQGRSKQAISDLEQAMVTLTEGEAGAEAKFELARALWAERPQRRRALALATEARVALAKAPSEAHTLKELDGWLAAHPWL
ncbi:MAG TPA: serine/threonine-protein kinase [Polyangia bacterium]|nr:serine/threonine-protein kinase [Polyangia bacterium]